MSIIIIMLREEYAVIRWIGGRYFSFEVLVRGKERVCGYEMF